MLERRVTTGLVWILAAGLHVWVLFAASRTAWRTFAARPDARPVSFRMAAPAGRGPAEFERPVADPAPAGRAFPAVEGVVEPAGMTDPWAGGDGEQSRADGETAPRIPLRAAEAPAFETRRREGLFREGTLDSRERVLNTSAAGGGDSPWAARQRERAIGLPGGPTTQTETAVAGGLRWLARHQAADGRWAAADFDRCCTGALCSGHGDPGNDVGLTSLALLAFLGAGYTPRSTATWTDPVTGRRVRPGEVVRNGLRWLLDGQDREGFFAPRGLQIYNHSLATMAVCEARGLSGATLFEAPARRGLEALVQAQNPYKAWRYFDRCGDNDTSNTGFAMMAFHSASLSGLHVPQSSLDWVRGYLDEVTDPYGPVGYMRRGDAGAVQYRRTEDWKLHRSMTGVGVMCRVFLDGGPKHGSVAPGVALLAADPPAWAPQAVDSYYWYYGTLAMFLATDPESGTWRRWNEAMVAAVVPHQRGRGDGCREGSWDPEPDRIAMEGAGRVYMTAINVLTLQVYYRYPRAFGVRK